MEGSLLLKLKPVKVCDQVGVSRLLLVVEEVLTPSVAVGTLQIPSHYLLKDVAHVEGSNRGRSMGSRQWASDL